MARLPDGYILEELDHYPEEDRRYFPGMLLELLQCGVWRKRDLLLVPDQQRWRGRLKEIFNVEAPDWVASASGSWLWSCIHGDPTFSNLLKGSDGCPRLIDPCHRDYVPPSRAVDVGKILQSCFGWETVQAGWVPQEYVLPESTLFEDETELRLALFWAGVHARRIRYRETDAMARGNILEWSFTMEQECWRHLGDFTR